GQGRRGFGGPAPQQQPAGQTPVPPGQPVRPRPTGPISIDIEGFEARVKLINVRPGSFSNLASLGDGKRAYVRQPARGVEGQQAGIKMIDINSAEPQEQTIADGIGGFSLSADGRKMVVRQGPGLAIIDVV